MALTKDEKKTIEEARDIARDLKVAISGIDGQGGLIEQFKNHLESFDNLVASHSKLRRNFWLLVGTLVGSGAIAGGVAGILNGG